MVGIHFIFKYSTDFLSAHRYSCLIVPHSPGAVHDLAINTTLGEVLAQFVRDRSKICVSFHVTLPLFLTWFGFKCK